MKKFRLLSLLFLSVIGGNIFAQTKSWTADNGNGTFTNPLLYDEFSDPDVIRVGDDYYLAGTTMHTVPGLVILHSKDLVNWENISYCFDRFDFDDDAFSLKNGKEIYGQGIWAPCIRYANGQFYLYSNVNGKGLQCYTSKDIHGPWVHHNMEGRIYDLSVLFDDDGKIYAIHGYGEVHCTELKPNMSGPIDETDRIIIPNGSAVGEGHHMYKIDGMYYLISTDYRPNGRTLCSRSKSIWGPYETVTITADETFGYHPVGLTQWEGRIVPDGSKFEIGFEDVNATAATNIHQGGIVKTQTGEWYALLMMDFHSVGRTVTLAPITWKDGWPMLGLEGNLGRAPRTWTKPNIPGAENIKPHAAYERNENFDGKQLGRVWQWNHNPEESEWRLKGGKLQLNTLPAEQLMWARNTLTQRAIGPRSICTVELYTNKLKDGDVAGLGNINVPCSWVGVVKNGTNLTLRCFEQLNNDTIDSEISLAKDGRIWLQLVGDYDNNIAHYAYSTDGKDFKQIGPEMRLSYQLVTFQGVRVSLFAFNKNGKKGGMAEFDNFICEELDADRSENIPYDKTFRIVNLATDMPMLAMPHGLLHDTESVREAPEGEQHNNNSQKETQFRIIDRGNGKVLLQCVDGRYVYVSGFGIAGDVKLTNDVNKAEEFMWQDYLNHEFMLMSTRTHTYIGKSPTTGSPYSMDYKGADPARKNGAVFRWEEVKTETRRMPRFDALDPDAHDPVMAKGEDGRYYCFTTGMNVGVMSSADLKEWRREPSALKETPAWAKDTVPGYMGHTWAPDISFHNGLWHLYYSCSTFGKNGSAIGHAVNKTLDPKSPDFGWVDKGMVIASHRGVDNWNAIDPNLIVGKDGQPYLTYGSFWDGIQLIKLSKDDFQTPLTKPVTIARRLEYKVSFEDMQDESNFTKEGDNVIEAGDNAIEAPFMFYHDGFYYLFVSFDYCCRGENSTYKTVYGRSKSIEGPFVDQKGQRMEFGGGTPLYGPDETYYGVGHNSAYEFDGQNYFFSHAYVKEKGGASKLFIRKLQFNKNGWIVTE